MISNEFKLEFLNDILTDTTELRIISSKEQLIATGILIPGMMPLHPSGGKSIKHSKFISDSLGINDTNFVKRQFKENREFDFMQLEKYGFRVFNLENFKKQNNSIDLYDTLEKLNEGYDSHFRTIITKPIFNKSKDKAYIMVNNFGGKTYVLEKVNGIWKIKSEFHEYIE